MIGGVSDAVLIALGTGVVNGLIALGMIKNALRGLERRVDRNENRIDVLFSSNGKRASDNGTT